MKTFNKFLTEKAAMSRQLERSEARLQTWEQAAQDEGRQAPADAHQGGAGDYHPQPRGNQPLGARQREVSKVNNIKKLFENKNMEIPKVQRTTTPTFQLELETIQPAGASLATFTQSENVRKKCKHWKIY